MHNLSEYIAKGVSKFGVDPICSDVTVTLEVNMCGRGLTIALAGHFPYHVLAGGVDATPPGVSKLSVVAICKEDQSITLDEYSRLVVYFLPWVNI